MLSDLSFTVTEYFPKDFFRNSVNEPFIQEIMSTVLERDNWRAGIPETFEPDYFCDNVPFEFTLASNSKKKNNFIQKLQRGIYSTDDVETDVISFISERIADKSTRHYSVPNVHLCVLCILDLFDWVSDEYGSVTHDLVDWRRKEFFEQIRAKYIKAKVFSNIFLIFPDISARWWVWDVLSGAKRFVQLSDEQIQSGKYPYCMINPDE